MKRTEYDKILERIERNKQGGDPNIGKKVGSSTLLVEEIGRGAMGAVYLGYDTKLERRVAVKVLLREMFTDENQYQLLKTLLVQEGRNLAKVRHRGVVEVHELDDEFPALIMELIEHGEDLQTFLYRKKSEWGTTGFRLWFLSIMEQIAFALGAAHSRGVVHKDLKFSNVMIFKDSEGEWRVKVIDFGLAQNLMRIKLTHGVTLLGTPHYMAPEQWDDHWSLDAKADVYSFGIMLYEVLLRCDFQEEQNNHEVIKQRAKDSLYVRKRVGHLPIDQRTPFEFLLAVERSKRAGGMLEVVGVLRNLRLAIMHRDEEAPGTSFPLPGETQKSSSSHSSYKMAQEAAEEFAENLATPPPVQVPSTPPQGQPDKPKYQKTMLGHPGKSVSDTADVETSASVEENSDSVEELPASAEEPVGSVEGTPVPASYDVIDEEEIEPSTPHVWWKFHLPIGLTLVILLIGLPVAYISIRNGDAGNSDNGDVSAMTFMNYASASDSKPVLKEKPKNPVKKVVTRKLPTRKPPTPRPPKIGELPSLSYVVHLFDRYDRWCNKHDKNRDKFIQMPVFRAFCLRKKAAELYERDRYNPELAVALLDEVRARLCFRELVYRKGYKDSPLHKECRRIRSWIYKKFTYFVKGKKLQRIHRYLEKRASHRNKIRARWKKMHKSSL